MNLAYLKTRSYPKSALFLLTILLNLILVGAKAQSKDTVSPKTGVVQKLTQPFLKVGKFFKGATFKIPSFKKETSNKKLKPANPITKAEPISSIVVGPRKKDSLATNKKVIEEKSVQLWKSVKVKFSTIHFSKLAFWKNVSKPGELHVSKTKFRKIKKQKIQQLNDKIGDIDLSISLLKEKKESIKNTINVLSYLDSAKVILRPEIIDYKTSAYATISIPVGFQDIDDDLRNLQLLGKIPSNHSFAVRPYYADTKQTYTKLLNLIDTNIKYNGQLFSKNNTSVILLPVNFAQKFNSDYPFGWNDGALNFSKGYQFQVSAGVYIQWHKLKLQLRPEYYSTASADYNTTAEWGQVSPAVKKFSLGQSSLRVDLAGLSISASTQNIWWGPGVYNSMIMSNNAPGFFHISLSSNKPITNFLGTFQFQIFSGTLTHDSVQGYENNNLKSKNYYNASTRYINAMNLSYQPAFMKNISFGITRSFQNFASSKITGFIPTYLPVLGSFFGSAYNDTIMRDQLIAFNTRWVFPKNNAEVYFEFGYNDAKDNFRDLMVDMSHSSGYIFGFKKLAYLKKDAFLDFGVEVTRMAPTSSQIMRSAGNFYEHGRIYQGYTNQNQIMGAGSGFGNNVQVAALSWNKGWNKVGFIFKRINQNPSIFVNSAIENLGMRTVKWDDYAYGMQGKYRYKKLLFSANLEWVDSRNYMWQANKNATNFYAFINTIFLW